MNSTPNVEEPYFCTIVEQGQISRAARKLNISQPTLSLALKELEEELGIVLIYRENGGWSISERGFSFYKEAQKILNQLEDLSQNIKNPFAKDSDIIGEVRIGCSSFCLSFIHAILPDLEREFPGIRTRLLVADNIRLESNLQQKSIDATILHLPLMNSACKVIPLREQKLVALWSPKLSVPLAGPVQLEELSRYPLLVSRRWSNRGALRPFMAAMQERGLVPRVVLDTPDSSFLLDSLDTLPAVAIMFDSEITPSHAAFYPMRQIEIPNLKFRPALVWLKDNLQTEAVKAVIDLICRHAGADISKHE